MGIVRNQITGPRSIGFKPIDNDTDIIDVPTIHFDEGV